MITYNFKGITLIEMLVVISILSILLGIGIFSYNKYALGRDVENDTYKIYSLAMKARTSAFTDKTTYYITLKDSKTVVLEDNATVIETLNLKSEFSYSNKNKYTFDKNGFLIDNGSIKSVTAPDVQYNCIRFEGTVYLGKLDAGGNCVQK